MPLVLDGKAAAARIKDKLSARVQALKDRGYTPGLGTLLVGEDPGSIKYVAGKHRDCTEIGIESLRIDLPETASPGEVIDAISRLNASSSCTGFIVQLPLPDSMDADTVIEHVDPLKDADGMHPYNLGRLVLHTNGIRDIPVPCTPRGILELLDTYHIDVRGKDVCVLGRGITIGRTMGMLLTTRGVDATVQLCHSMTQGIEAKLRQADIIISATGQAHFVKPQMVKPGAVLIDVGVSRVWDDAAGKWRIHGDIDPECYPISSAYTPNPGGVGPMTRAMLLSNVVDMAERIMREA